MKRSIAFAGVLGLGLTVTGCNTPYELSINEINESGPQRPAVIALSDPQLYTRERLLNDRDDEVAFLRNQLAQVDRLDYTPRLKRDIDTLLEVVAAVSLKFDPVAGADIRQQAEINAIKNEAEIEKLKILLEDLKTKTAEDLGGPGAIGDADTVNASGLAPAGIQETIAQINGLLKNLEDAVKARLGGASTRPELRASQVSDATPSEVFRDKVAYRNEVQAALEQAQLDDRHDLVGNALYRLQFKATIFPGEHKDKYAVTRLTILPPVFENDAAVSRLYLDWLAFVARELNPARTPGVTPEDASSVPDSRQAFYRTLGPATGMYRVGELPVQLDAIGNCRGARDLILNKAVKGGELRGFSFRNEDVPGGNCRTLLVATHVSVEQYQLDLVADKDASKLMVGALKRLRDDVQNKSNIYIGDELGRDERRCYDLFINGRVVKPSLRDPMDSDVSKKITKDVLLDGVNQQWSDSAVRLLVGWARNIVNLGPSYALAIDRARGRFADQAGAGQILDGYLTNLGELQASAIGLLAALQNDGRQANKDHLKKIADAVASGSQLTPEQVGPIACDLYDEVVGRIWVPRAFYYSVVHTDESHELDPSEVQNTQANFTQGDAFAYSTAPTEFAQRVSTVASATQAMDLIASISALIPSANVGVSAAGQLRQVATGRADAIESVPLIVGFSNNGAANAASGQFMANRDEPSFGWVFGPKVTVDTERDELALTQILVNQPVTADISVPGWWRSVRLRVETAWANGFDDAMFEAAPLAPSREPVEPERPKQDAPWDEWLVYYGRLQLYVNDKANIDAWRQRYGEGRERFLSYVIDVPLQSNPETFEQLTEYIATRAWGVQQKKPVIADFFPKKLPACEQVTLLIAGPDLWRGRKVYLNGVPAIDTKIMPDMRGLEATFRLPASAVGPGEIVVWTQLGMEKTDPGSGPEIVGSDKCKAAGVDVPTASVRGPSAVIPGEKVVLVVEGSLPQAGYDAVLRLDKAGQEFRLDIGKEGVQRDENAFTVTMPGADKFKASDLLNEGDQFSLTLRLITPDETRAFARSPALYYYPTAIQTLLRDIKLDWKGANQIGTITATLPRSFAQAYGDNMSAKIGGLVDKDNKPAPPVDGTNVSATGGILTIEFDPGAGVRANNKKLSVTLRVNGTTLPAFEVSTEPPTA